MRTRRNRQWCFTLALTLLAILLPLAARAQLPQFLLAWGTQGSAPGQFEAVLGVAVAPNGNVYTCDAANNRIQVFTGAGVFLTQWGNTGTGNGQFRRPYGIAVDAAGDVYVADSDNDRIQKFTGTGEYVTQWGSRGFDPGQFWGVRAVAVDAGGTVFVGDAGAHGLQRFTSAGTLLGEWDMGFGGWTFGGHGVFGIAFDASGNVYVANSPSGGARIDKLTSTGIPVAMFSHSGFRNGLGTMGVVVDAASRVYLMEGFFEEIAIFEGNGALAGVLGGSGSSPGQFNTPYGVALDTSGHLYVADAGNHRVQKFGPCGATPTQTGTWGRLKSLYR